MRDTGASPEDMTKQVAAYEASMDALRKKISTAKNGFWCAAHAWQSASC